MNNLPTIAVVGWETRNWRHRERALKLCKNYGFEPIVKNVHIGDVYMRERAELQQKMKRIFTGKTDKFFFAIMCRACFDSSSLASLSKKKVMKSEMPFELVQMPENGKKR